MKIPNITYVKYTNLKDKSEYNYYLRYGNFKSKDLFELGNFVKLNFGFVKDMQEQYNSEGLTWESFIEAISEKKDIKMSKLGLIPLFDLHCARLFMKDELDKINLIENNKLSHTASSDEERAGINIFGSYKAFLQYDKLAGGDILKIEKIKQIPYGECFLKLSLDADSARYENALNKIRSTKK